MKTITTILALATTVLMMTACHTNTFKIEGVADGYEDGDTLVIYEALTNDALDTLFVKDGHFTYESDIDSVILCALTPADHSAFVVFIREPGTIRMTLSKTEPSTIAGTEANDAWQAMNDKQAEIQAKVEDLVGSITSEDEENANQDSIVSEYNRLLEESAKSMINLVETNIDNEFAYIVITQMGRSDIFTPEKLAELIGKMPEKFKKRQAIMDLERDLEATKNTAVGATLDDFFLPTPDTMGISVLNEVKKNKITVLDFWASWCGPCRNEMPFMKDLLEKYREKGFGIIGISVDQDAEAWKTAIEELGLTWLQVWDNQQKMSSAFRVQAIPFTVVVDQQGKILAKELRGTDLEAFVNEQLAK